MAELAAAPRRGEPPALSPYLRPLGWSMQQSRSTGEWYYVRTAPDGRRVRQRESPGYGWRAVLLLAPDRADQLFEEAEAVAVASCAADTAGQTCYICYGEGEGDVGLVGGCSCCGGNGFAHVSCLAEQAKILYEEARENNLGNKALDERWARWYTCGLCEQNYHGVVRCALGWACWKTYVERPETDQARWFAIARRFALTQLGLGLYKASHYEDALTVFMAELSIKRQLGAPERFVLATQSDLARTYRSLGRLDDAMRLRREIYSRRLELYGEEQETTILAALNYAFFLDRLEHYAEAKSLLRRATPVARRALGEGHMTTLMMRGCYATTLYEGPDATLDDLREAATTFEEMERTARRLLGSAHPTAKTIERSLQKARATLRGREDRDDESLDDADDTE